MSFRIETASVSNRSESNVSELGNSVKASHLGTQPVKNLLVHGALKNLAIGHGP